jgi:signal transduction histidine kinase/CheY-like chemotaxis protein
MAGPSLSRHAANPTGAIVAPPTQVAKASPSHARSHGDLSRLNESLAARLAATAARLESEIAERTALELALRQSQKMEVVGQLTGGIAHDFNNHLTGVIGSLDLLQRRLAQGQLGELERYAAIAMQSANRAASLAHRLLAFSRVRPADPKPTDLGRLICGMEDLLRRTLSEAIELEAVLPQNLWQPCCDANQLENAVLNLAINARDAMEGGGRLTISTANRSVDPTEARRLEVSPGDYVSIAVQDNGCGMSQEVIDHIFEPFFTTKPVGVGTGLGVPMAFSFARQSGGSLTIDSAGGVGTTVTLLLPRSPGHEIASEVRLAQNRADRLGQGRVVVVVEDGRAVRSLVMEILQEHGFRGISATDGTSGLNVLQSAARVDLLVTDVGLPGIDGAQLAAAAIRNRPGLKVIFMTGHTRESPIHASLLQTGSTLIEKPFTAEELLGRIRECLPKSQSQAGH